MTEQRIVFAGMDDVGLHMLIDNFKQLKEDTSANQQEVRAEFARIREQIADVRADMNRELRAHDKYITELDTQAKIAGKISGRIAGAISGVVVTIIIMLLNYILQTPAV